MITWICSTKSSCIDCNYLIFIPEVNAINLCQITDGIFFLDLHNAEKVGTLISNIFNKSSALLNESRKDSIAIKANK